MGGTVPRIDAAISKSSGGLPGAAEKMRSGVKESAEKVSLAVCPDCGFNVGSFFTTSTPTRNPIAPLTFIDVVSGDFAVVADSVDVVADSTDVVGECVVAEQTSAAQVVTSKRVANRNARKGRILRRAELFCSTVKHSQPETINKSSLHFGNYGIYFNVRI